MCFIKEPLCSWRRLELQPSYFIYYYLFVRRKKCDITCMLKRPCALNFCVCVHHFLSASMWTGQIFKKGNAIYFQT